MVQVIHQVLITGHLVADHQAPDPEVPILQDLHPGHHPPDHLHGRHLVHHRALHHTGDSKKLYDMFKVVHSFYGVQG